MWRRAYLCLVLLRLYIALRPSYLHPDEHFQGPETIAGRVFGFPVTETWEFASEKPIRGSLPLWLNYGIPMTFIKWLSEGAGYGPPRPAIVFFALRVVMFLLSFVLEDWAIHELIDVPRRRRVAILLVASSYVTWTWQAHTFSNSFETLLVTWSLVLIKRIMEHRDSRSPLSTPAALGVLLALGVFTRITFPAFLMVPCAQLTPELFKRPSTVIVLISSLILTSLLAVYNDTVFFSSQTTTFKDFLHNPVLTPLNGLLYNTKATNLEIHGRHPLYQHALVNLPQLLGPALVLLFHSPVFGLPFVSAISGTAMLSLVPHQEARFLLPAVPLFLSSLQMPLQFKRSWLATWIVFNAGLALLMGVYHQAGIVPAQMWLESQQDFPTADVFWWKTYSPPTWLLDGRNGKLQTVDLMGLPSSGLQSAVCNDSSNGRPRLLTAPTSATFLEQYQSRENAPSDAMALSSLWSTRTHINLDDLDFGDDGVYATLARVIGKRGLTIWKVQCSPAGLANAGSFLKDW